jgi:hypothetical protein
MFAKVTAFNSGSNAAPEYRLGLRHNLVPRVRCTKSSFSRGTLGAIAQMRKYVGFIAKHIQN